MQRAPLQELSPPVDTTGRDMGGLYPNISFFFLLISYQDPHWLNLAQRQKVETLADVAHAGWTPGGSTGQRGALEGQEEDHSHTEPEESLET